MKGVRYRPGRKSWSHCTAEALTLTSMELGFPLKTTLFVKTYVKAWFSIVLSLLQILLFVKRENAGYIPQLNKICRFLHQFYLNVTDYTRCQTVKNQASCEVLTIFPLQNCPGVPWPFRLVHHKRVTHNKQDSASQKYQKISNVHTSELLFRHLVI